MRIASLACAIAALGCAGLANAADGRLLGTGGASQIEGAAGGGLVSWAVMAGYGTEDENDIVGFVTHVRSDDYTLTTAGAAWTWRNRLELSYARQSLNIGALAGALAIPSDSRLALDVVGAKLRLAGDLVYGRLPQISFGLQHKRHRDFAIPAVAGAASDTGDDVYLSVSRLFLAGPFGRSVVVNGGVRSTSANQLGLLGFGGDAGGRSLQGEASVALLLSHKAAIGAEYRQKPDNLSFAVEDDWFDLFGAYFFSKKLSAVAAYARLGDVATLRDQRAFYLSLQGSF